LSDTVDEELDRIDIFIRFATAIVKAQYSTLPDDIIRDIVIGGVTTVLAGETPSAVMLLTAYDMQIAPTAQGIVDYIYAERRKVKETYERTT
jgi:hypothetical protein